MSFVKIYVQLKKSDQWINQNWSFFCVLFFLPVSVTYFLLVGSWTAVPDSFSLTSTNLMTQAITYMLKKNIYLNKSW